MFRILSPGNSISEALRKLLQRGRVRLYTSLQQREQAVWTSKIRYQVKEFGILCMGRCKSLGSLNSFLSYTPQLSETKSCFLVHLKEWHMAASCIPPSSSAVTVRGGGICWITVLGALIHIWRPEINDGCDISYLFIWQEMFSFHSLSPCS